jgi:hypothetical protein
MKKLLLSSAALTLFSISILIFQISCKKDALAQTGPSYVLPPATSTSLGGVIAGSGLNIAANGTLSVAPVTGGLTQQNIIFYIKNLSPADTYEYWLANLDGTNQHKVNITLGANVALRDEARLSPDGTKIIFTAEDSITGIDAVYSVAIAGGNATKIIDGGANARISLNGVN